jgi:hypothetical protein
LKNDKLRMAVLMVSADHPDSAACGLAWEFSKVGGLAEKIKSRLKVEL